MDVFKHSGACMLPEFERIDLFISDTGHKRKENKNLKFCYDLRSYWHAFILTIFLYSRCIQCYYDTCSLKTAGRSRDH